jgi:hypothetical protein
LVPYQKEEVPSQAAEIHVLIFPISMKLTCSFANKPRSSFEFNSESHEQLLWCSRGYEDHEQLSAQGGNRIVRAQLGFAFLAPTMNPDQVRIPRKAGLYDVSRSAALRGGEFGNTGKCEAVQAVGSRLGIAAPAVPICPARQSAMSLYRAV